MYINNDINYLSYLVNRDVYIFGCGIKGQKCYEKLKKNNIHAMAYVDNNLKMHGKKIKEILVLDIGELKEVLTIYSTVVICSKSEREIKKQLLENNIFNFISVEQIDFGGGEEYYDESYFEYQCKMGEFGGKIKKEIFKPYVNESDVVVEFGSGGGYLLANLDARKKIGIEINDTARENAQKLGIESVKHISDLPDDFADLIISTSVLEHIENPFGALTELRKKLKKNGKIVFHVPNESCETEYHRNDINNHFYTWNCLNIGNLFKAAGFFVYSVERVQEVWPKNYRDIAQEVSKELFEELCLLGGRAFCENRCIIVAYK